MGFVIFVGIAASGGMIGCYRATERDSTDPSRAADGGAESVTEASRSPWDVEPWDATTSGIRDIGMDPVDASVPADAQTVADVYREVRDGAWDDARSLPFCSQPDARASFDAAASRPTIDWIRGTWGYLFTAGYGLTIVGPGIQSAYHLSDGTTWSGGQHGAFGHPQLRGVEVAGTQVRFHLVPSVEPLWFQSDYDSSDAHSARFRLEVVDDLVAVGEVGGHTLTLSTYVEVTADEPIVPSPTFESVSAPLCAVVSLTVTYRLIPPRTVAPDLFASDFEADAITVVDFRMGRP